MSIKIDFVIPWVDGNDPQWQQEFQKYSPEDAVLNTFDRYRDWDNLQYLFRSFEYFTPWVNKIFFVTYGHLPKWLNTDHPKLVIVNHSDFLDPANLPVFSSHPIEINLHRIKGLSEHFVYFNDDTFLLKPLKPTDFFYNGLPLDFAVSNVMHEGLIAHIILNNVDIINKNFNRHISSNLTKRAIIKQNFLKWFNPKYGKYNFQTLLLLYWKTFTGFLNYHHAQPFLKSTFQELWEKENNLLSRVSSSKFRNNNDVSQYLFRYWQLVRGKFEPLSTSIALNLRPYKELRTLEDAFRIASDIQSGCFEMYCINDATSKSRFTKATMPLNDFNSSKEVINFAFQKILPNKSKFEL